MIGGATTACCSTSRPTTSTSPRPRCWRTAIDKFDGTVLTISHDRYFLDRICTRILELADGEVTEYIGGYSDYVDRESPAQGGGRSGSGRGGAAQSRGGGRAGASAAMQRGKGKKGKVGVR